MLAPGTYEYDFLKKKSHLNAEVKDLGMSSSRITQLDPKAGGRYTHRRKKKISDTQALEKAIDDMWNPRTGSSQWHQPPGAKSYKSFSPTVCECSMASVSDF